MNTRIAFRSALLAMSTLGTLAVPATARAESTASQAGAAHDFNVPAQPLARALSAIAEQADIQVVYPDKEPLSIDAPAVRGRMTTGQALAAALAGSGYSYRFLREGVVTLVSAGGNDGEVVTGAVSVEGVQGSPYFGGAGQAAGVNGVNGSRDITATEGTGSFTSGALTIGSKVPQALKDVPQSISVLTSERLAQQNVTDFTTAMKQLPGITLVQGPTSLENTFYSRGFQIQSIQVDGGAPLSTSFGIGQGFFPQIDMSIYDHVELLRGADGQFGAYGDPGGSVNLVRKKPLDHSQFSIEAQAGSWQNYRVVADATSPLALDGRLRGRLVMTYQNNHYFYNTAKDSKELIYGIAEFDATPTTLITAGINYTKQDSVPWYRGLPRYLNGDDLELPRSTSLVFPWNRWNFDTTEIFGGFEQKLGGDWNFKVNLTRNRQTSTRKIGYSNGAVNPTNHQGPTLSGDYNNYAGKQFSAEATLSGSVNLFGQRQEVTIGVNRVKSDAGGLIQYDSLVNTYLNPYQPYPGGPTYCQDYGAGVCPIGSVASGVPIDVLAFDPTDALYTEPRTPLPNYRHAKFATIQTGAYINLRLTAFDWLHLATSFHWSRYTSATDSEKLCITTSGSCSGMEIGASYDHQAETYGASDVSWPPPVSLSVDLTKSLTAYVGYADIYQSQAYYVDANLNPMPPITGANWEGGVKWSTNGGRLNLSLAAYRTTQRGFASVYPADYSGYHEVSPGVSCCFVVEPDAAYRSRGLDFEATGEIARGWQFSASYTYNENRREGAFFGIVDGAPASPIVTIAPKHLYKLWMSYDFAAAGHEGRLSGLTLSAGVNGQSSGYNEGYTCVNLVGEPNSVTGAQDCASYSPPDFETYHFTVPAYAVFSGRVDYRINNQWSIAANIENIFDKIYYQTAGSIYSDNWYGTPRSVTATLRAKW